MFRVLIALAIISICFSQDALISPKDPYTIKLNSSQSYSESYLVEINIQKFMAQWGTLVAHYHSQNPQAIVQTSFKVVHKQDPNQVWAVLGKCRFQGNSAQWCKIGQKSPPLNLHHHLLKAEIECPSSCQADILLGMTQTTWDGQSNPKFVGGPMSNSMGPLLSKKTFYFMKLGGWMLFTLFAVLGAIKFAVWVADRNDKSKKNYQAYKDD